MLADDLIRATFSSDEELKSTLLQAIKELGFTVTKFAEISGVSSSTLYKIISGEREPNLKTLREILQAVRRLEGASPTVEKILRIPVASIMPQNSLVEAIKLAARKIS